MKVGDLVTARVIHVGPLLAMIVADDQRGVIRGPAANGLTVGRIIKVLITETPVGERFEARLIHA